MSRVTLLLCQLLVAIIALALWQKFRDLSIETKMLGIILPLVAIPMIILGTVGYVASAGQAETTGSRYLNERSNDLQTISENPSIRDYFDNRYYGLLYHFPITVNS